MKVYVVIKDHYVEYGDHPDASYNEYQGVYKSIDEAIKYIDQMTGGREEEDLLYKGYVKDCTDDYVREEYICDDTDDTKWIVVYEGQYYGSYNISYSIKEQEIK